MNLKIKEKTEPFVIEEKNNIFSEMVQSLPDPVLVLDAAQRIRFANDAALMFFQKGCRAIAGLPLSALLGVQSGALAERIAEASAKKSAFRAHGVTVAGRGVESAYFAPFGGEGEWLLTFSPGHVPVREDWSSKINATIKPAQHLARTLAHEIKNPLAGIQGAAQLLSRSGLGPEDLELARIIHSEAARVLRLLEKVQVLGAEPAEMHLLNIHAPVEEALHALTVDKKPDIRQDFDPSLPEILGRHDELVQVFLNFLLNAVQAGADKIVLRSYYRNGAFCHPESRARLPICVEVSDNGKGMSAETQARLFEPYYTTKPDGEGLGLSIVWKIVDAHGGIVDVDARPGRTVFTVALPLGGES